ncbi:carbamoyl phosphate synthase large subunit [Deltaproteobacteria bacterium Smac51]|nr:carbamoyl phosphate synthase large subunit [Deltaproteobacteria bacterium Smac51]
MPKDPTLKKIMLLGSGPIIIGQACEFDYSGTQACRALREEGCQIVLVNSNPATVMTDPSLSDRTYVEPMTPDVVAEIIRKERPDAVLPTFGGQTALNLAMDLAKSGVLEECGVRLIGADVDVIERAEDREVFRKLITGLGLYMAGSITAASFEEAAEFVGSRQFPVVIRPSFTLGGTGGGIAFNMEELKEAMERGLAASPVHEVLVEESLLGWKEIELEVIRDRAGNAVVVCGIENFDPMGVHTGDSITVAPIQTMADVEYQELRNEGIAIVNAVGVETGGCNIQFAVCPKTGKRAVIEMNPRVSRSSALASKATGFPIARIATKLALGYHLDELQNSITRQSCAAFEPSVDYCVVKAPRFDFEKFPGAKPILGFQMKSVGETMALGRNFREAFQKSLRGLEIGQSGFTERPARPGEKLPPLDERLRDPGPYRAFYLKEAMRKGYGVDQLSEMTGIDPWFLDQLNIIHQEEKHMGEVLGPLFSDNAPQPGPAEAVQWRRFKTHGFSDSQIAYVLSREGLESMDEDKVRRRRLLAGVKPTFRAVDTCAGEFEAYTPYFYSTYQGSPDAGEVPAGSSAKKIMILGGGPNRIGQGVEFDYCCVQAAMALREAGWQTIMVNSNPETVSTDFDMADRLYFEPLTVEDILAICEEEKPYGVLVQCGGQTPLNLSRRLKAAGVPIVGTSPEDIFLAEDRGAFNKLAAGLGIKQPQGGQAGNVEAACRIAQEVGYPVMARPDFVLGGRAMKIVNDEAELRRYWDEALSASSDGTVFIDRFLEDAVEMDVDALCDGEEVVVAAIMEHVEQAGVHSGDSACSIYPHTFTADQIERIRRHTTDLALALNTRGLINVQYAVQGDDIYLLEANPRASRTVPFVAKATGWPLARLAALVMTGTPLSKLPKPPLGNRGYNAVKEVKMPFDRFPGARIELGAEMRSTGEVMGLAVSFGQAFIKAQLAAGHKIPREGGVLLSICDHDKSRLVEPARKLVALGFKLYATQGTRRCLTENGLPCELVNKMAGSRPNLIDCISDGKIQLAVNTISGQGSARDGMVIRAENLKRGIPTYTTISALEALVEGLQRWGMQNKVAALQDFYTV